MNPFIKLILFGAIVLCAVNALNRNGFFTKWAAPTITVSESVVTAVTNGATTAEYELGDSFECDAMFLGCSSAGLDWRQSGVRHVAALMPATEYRQTMAECIKTRQCPGNVIGDRVQQFLMVPESETALSQMNSVKSQSCAHVSGRRIRCRWFMVKGHRFTNFDATTSFLLVHSIRKE